MIKKIKKNKVNLNDCNGYYFFPLLVIHGNLVVQRGKDGRLLRGFYIHLYYNLNKYLENHWYHPQEDMTDLLPSAALNSQVTIPT